MAEQVIEVATVLERFDVTDPKLQREIVARFAAEAAVFREVLRKIASVEIRPQDADGWPGKGLVACRDTAIEALQTTYKLV